MVGMRGREGEVKGDGMGEGEMIKGGGGRCRGDV